MIFMTQNDLSMMAETTWAQGHVTEEVRGEIISFSYLQEEFQ